MNKMNAMFFESVVRDDFNLDQEKDVICSMSVYNDRIATIFSKIQNMYDSIFTHISILMYMGTISMDNKASITSLARFFLINFFSDKK